MKKILFLLLLALAFSAHAEVYKCSLPDGKTVYQPTPCLSTKGQEVVEIKDISPERLEQAQEELQQFQKTEEEKRLAEEAAQKEQEKTQREQAVVDALSRSAAAQEQRAQAEANRASPGVGYPQVIVPGYVPVYPPYQRPGLGTLPYPEPKVKYEFVPPVTPKPGR